MRTVAIVQSRFGSSRLPGKALMSLGGRPLLSHVLQRVQAMTTIDDVLLATTWDERDTALVTLAASMGIPAWRGSMPDVLLRFHEAAEFANADVIVRVTGDCPLYCPDIGDRVVALYHSRAMMNVYAWNDTARSGYPDGTDVEVFGRSLLELAHQTTHSVDHCREHVTGPVRMLASVILTERPAFDMTALKLSVDRPEDYDRVRSVIEHLPSTDLNWPTVYAACHLAGLFEGV